MDVQLEILQGRLQHDKQVAAVNQFPIRLPRFLIGSDPSCQMVCKSRTISQRHCLLLIENGQLLVRDLQSQAGTFINEIPVRGTLSLSHGDKLRVGRLEFRVLIAEPAAEFVAAQDEPASDSASSDSASSDSASSDAAADEQNRETLAPSDTVESMITDLLSDEDQAAREARCADPSLRYFRADQIPAPKPVNDAPRQRQAPRRPERKPVGKLPPPPPIEADDTVSAAEQALDEFFQTTKERKKR